MVQKKWGVLPSLFILVPLFTGIAKWAAFKHYGLPTPVGPVTRDDPRPSESHILAIAQHLSETIGYRTVGTKEHAEGDAWMLQQVQRLKAECDHIVREVHVGRNVECEVWRQEGSGHHRFDIMGYRLYKTYVNLSNIIVRVSNGTAAGKEHAILVNSHIDSTPPSPGAADDALPVGVMLECIRVLVHTQDWEPKHAIIFLFNNAEESLQDGSHLYSTQHSTASTVRAAINLEAAGTMGPELLFQATSDEMVEAYAHVPRPYGTVLANDVFSSGIILSELRSGLCYSTDFRQFQQYLNVTGVDMAIVGHSYFYHTQKDIVEHIEPGVAQHMADNTLALLHHFTSSASPLPALSSLTPYKPRIVYFSLLGSYFFTFSSAFASAMYTTFLGATLALVWELAPRRVGLFTQQMRGLRNFVSGLVGALVGVNVVAAVMKMVLGRGMSWFSREWLPIVLYGPPAVLGSLLPQLLFFHPAYHDEQATMTSAILAYAFLSTVLQAAFEVGSAVFLFVCAVPLFIALVLSGGEVRLRTYALGGFLPVMIGTEVWCGVADVFVPLTGRMGEKAPAEFIIATITAFSGFYAFPLLVPFAHRMGRRTTQTVILILSALSVSTICIMAMRNPYDPMHPKRLYVVHSENITTGEVHLNFAGADSAAGLPKLVDNLAHAFGEASRGPEFELSVVQMNDWNGDWDTLYPFSAFLTPYKIRLPNSTGQTSQYLDKFRVIAEKDVVDLHSGTRSLTLRVYHPGVIWTVIAFDAHVLRWSLDMNPPPHFARHHVKEASFYGIDSWSIDLLIQLPTGGTSDAGLKVNFVGTKEAVQWPAKHRLPESEKGAELRLLEEMHDWLNVTSGGSIDALLFGTVGGVTVL